VKKFRHVLAVGKGNLCRGRRGKKVTAAGLNRESRLAFTNMKEKGREFGPVLYFTSRKDTDLSEEEKEVCFRLRRRPENGVVNRSFLLPAFKKERIFRPKRRCRDE